MTCPTKMALDAAKDDLTDDEKRMSILMVAVDSTNPMVRRAVDAALIAVRLAEYEETEQAARIRRVMHQRERGWRRNPAVLKRVLKVVERFGTADDLCAFDNLVDVVTYNHPRKFHDLMGKSRGRT